MPYAPGGTEYWTTYTYDGLGRTLSVQKPDGASTTTYSYLGNQTAVTDPASWNRYAYVEGDPVNKNDPTGLCSYDPGTGNYTDDPGEPCPNPITVGTPPVTVHACPAGYVYDFYGCDPFAIPNMAFIYQMNFDLFDPISPDAFYGCEGDTYAWYLLAAAEPELAPLAMTVLLNEGCFFN